MDRMKMMVLVAGLGRLGRLGRLGLCSLGMMLGSVALAQLPADAGRENQGEAGADAGMDGQRDMAYFGVISSSLSEDLAAILPMAEGEQGVMLIGLDPEGPAAEGGLIQGDVIVSIGDDVAPGDPVDFRHWVQGFEVGAVQEVELIRLGQRIRLNVEIGRKPVRMVERQMQREEAGRQLHMLQHNLAHILRRSLQGNHEGLSDQQRQFLQSLAVAMRDLRAAESDAEVAQAIEVLNRQASTMVTRELFDVETVDSRGQVTRMRVGRDNRPVLFFYADDGELQTAIRLENLRDLSEVPQRFEARAEDCMEAFREHVRER